MILKSALQAVRSGASNKGGLVQHALEHLGEADGPSKMKNMQSIGTLFKEMIGVRASSKELVAELENVKRGMPQYPFRQVSERSLEIKKVEEQAPKSISYQEVKNELLSKCPNLNALISSGDTAHYKAAMDEFKNYGDELLKSSDPGYLKLKLYHDLSEKISERAAKHLPTLGLTEYTNMFKQQTVLLKKELDAEYKKPEPSARRALELSDRIENLKNITKSLGPRQ